MKAAIVIFLSIVNILWAQAPPEPMSVTENVSADFNWAAAYGKPSSQFTVNDWRDVIDQRWGPGLPTAEKLRIFDFWWNEVHLTFAGFHHDDIDIFALRDKYRPEIEAGVSRGRFAAIMNHFTYQLNELHTYIFDVPVWATTKTKGTPLFTIGQWGLNRHFGALLTPLRDKSLLVYKVLPNHPIGLEPGDLVLGYDGVPWKDLYPALLEAELPIFYNSVNASTDEGNEYYILQAAGLNWHLFDRIDVVKYATGDTLHFNTAALANQNRTLWGSEQVDVPGVTWPDRSRNDRVSWGVVEGTQTGYIYVTSWSFDAQFNIRQQFRNAVDSLMHHTETDGIIFDFRFNTGGGALAADGLSLLFNTSVPTVGFDRKVRSTNPFLMEPDPLRQEFRLIIQGDPNTYYDKPIAILIGPGSISAGELEALRLSFHPRARIFGKAAPGGNTGSDFIDVGNSDWFASLSNSSMYLASTHEYLVHIGLQPDFPVWFKQADVANGIDTVVEAALAWIEEQSATGIVRDDVDTVPQTLKLKQNYPNPFNPTTTIEFSLPGNTTASLKIYNQLGEAVAELFSGALAAGSYRYRWEAADYPSGVYYYQLISGSQSSTRKMILLR